MGFWDTATGWLFDGKEAVDDYFGTADQELPSRRARGNLRLPIHQNEPEKDGTSRLDAYGPFGSLHSGRTESLQFPSDLEDYSQGHFVRFTILQNEGQVWGGRPTPPTRFTRPERNSEGVPIPGIMRRADGGGSLGNNGDPALVNNGKIVGAAPIREAAGIKSIALQSAIKTAEVQEFTAGVLKTRIEKFVGPAVKDAVGYGAKRFLPPTVGRSGGGIASGILGGITGALGSAVSGLASGGLGGALSGLTGSISGSVGGALSGALGTLTGSIGGQLGSALGQIGDRIGGQLGNALGGVVQNQLIGIVGQAQGSLGGVLTGGIAGLGSPIINNIVRETAGAETFGAIGEGLSRALSIGGGGGGPNALGTPNEIFTLPNTLPSISVNKMDETNQILSAATGAVTTSMENQAAAAADAGGTFFPREAAEAAIIRAASTSAPLNETDPLFGAGSFAGSQGGTATSFSDTKGGKTTIMGDILLYLPVGISESYQPKWNGMETGLAGAGRAMMKGEQDASILANLGQLGNLTGTAQEILGNIAGGLLNNSSLTPEFLKSGVFAGQEIGRAINPHFEMYFQSVAPRTFTFNFKFVPKNEDESKTVQDIIRAFKYNAAPAVMTGSVRFWNYPMLFGIEYWNEQQTHKILPCALENITVNYGASGTNHTFYDGRPVQTDMTLTFKETDLLTRENFSASPTKGGY